MPAKLSLDRFQLLWLCEGAIGKSHLRWDIYPMMVNDVWPQLSDEEREILFTYIKRDESWMFSGGWGFDETPRQYYLQMLARYNPTNQYIVTLKDGRKKQITDNAYKWDGKYYVGWQRYCSPENIIKVEQKPYKKCTNDWCRARQLCLRFPYNEGDKKMWDDTKRQCDKCDFIIVGANVIDPVAEMVITPEKQK